MHSQEYYDSYWSEGGFNPRDFQLPQALVPLLNQAFPRSSRCLDIGCGTGHKIANWVKEQGIDYTGVDVSGEAIAGLQSLGLDGVQIEDPTRLPFDDASFDGVISFEVLEHLFAPLDVIHEAYRVLKPGGTLIVTVPNAAHVRVRFQLLRGVWNPNGDPLSIPEPWRDPHIRFFTKDALTSMILRAGFTGVSAGGHVGLPQVGGRFMPRFLLTKNPAYAALRANLPTLFAGNLHAVATRPSTTTEHENIASMVTGGRDENHLGTPLS